jgi:hypothetical protein
MTPEILNAYLEAITAGVPPEAASALRQEMSTWPTVEQIPIWEEVVVTYDDWIWISPDVTMRLPPELVTDVAPRRWVVLDSAGRPAASVTTPPGFTLLDGSGDRIIGVYTDEFGVQSIRAYGLGR